MKDDEEYELRMVPEAWVLPLSADTIEMVCVACQVRELLHVVESETVSDSELEVIKRFMAMHMGCSQFNKETKH